MSTPPRIETRTAKCKAVTLSLRHNKTINTSNYRLQFGSIDTKSKVISSRPSKKYNLINTTIAEQLNRFKYLRTTVSITNKLNDNYKLNTVF